MKTDEKTCFIDYINKFSQKEVDMPKKYSEVEKANIKKDLRLHAERSLFHKGVKGTSVDELVNLAMIPKGTFYLFYETKEALFFDVLVSFRLQMQDEMMAMLQELDENHIVTSLTTVFAYLVENMYRRGIFRLLNEEEMHMISRKNEEDIYKKERKELLSFFRELFSLFAIDDKDDIDAFFNSFLLIVYSMNYADRMKKPLDAWRMLLRGLILQLVGE